MKVGTRSHADSSLMVRISMALPQRMREKTREITKLHTPAASQGKGFAAELLRRTCEEADMLGITLVLWPRPYGDDIALSQGQLIEWYSRFGFKKIQVEPPMMARMPGASVQSLTPTASAVALYG